MDAPSLAYRLCLTGPGSTMAPCLAAAAVAQLARIADVEAVGEEPSWN